MILCKLIIKNAEKSTMQKLLKTMVFTQVTRGRWIEGGYHIYIYVYTIHMSISICMCSIYTCTSGNPDLLTKYREGVRLTARTEARTQPGAWNVYKCHRTPSSKPRSST